jgi:hypothetical protein
MRVRLEPWRRFPKGGNTPMYYVSVYPAESVAGTEPLLAVTVTAEVIADLRADDIFDLYGSGRPGEPVAMRADNVEILSTSKTHDAHWESGKRAANSQVDLAPRASRGPSVSAFRGRVFADEDEALTYHRLTRLGRLGLPILFSFVFVRLLPDHLLWAAIPLLALVMGVGAIFAVRQRRIVTRIARRISDEPLKGSGAKRLARQRATDLVNSEAGQAELARYLHISREELAGQDRRASILTIGSTASVFLLMLAVIAIA